MNRDALRIRLLAICAWLVCSLHAFGQSGQANSFVSVGDQLPVLQRAQDTGPADPAQSLRLVVSLPFAVPQSADAFANAVSNPSSPDYRQFITPEEVGHRFGLPEGQVHRAVDYLKVHGFTVLQVADSRLAILARATVAQAESAFNVTIRQYTIPQPQSDESSQFLANSGPPRVPLDLSGVITGVGGLETYTRVKSNISLLTPALAQSLYKTAGMLSAGFAGNGRTVGIESFGGFRQADYVSYVNVYQLPTPPGGAGTNVGIRPVNGGGANAGPLDPESTADIQMVLSTAPLADVWVYDSPPSPGWVDYLAMLVAQVNDNTCDIITSSHALNTVTVSQMTEAHNQHVAMSMQGITYLVASGDSGTGAVYYPEFEPEILSVGGTVADVDPLTGTRISEVGWSGSGGGWSTSTVPFNAARPSWQQGQGVPPITPATNHRLYPDVAFHASGPPQNVMAYQFIFGGLVSEANGTSLAAPMFAGCLSVIEERAISIGGLPPSGAGFQRFGRIQDLIYSQNGRRDIWYDITSGTNGTLPNGGISTCAAGWDTVTGWGPMDCEAFALASASATCNPSGLLVSLGDNSYGQSSPPSLPPGLTYIKIAAGANHTVAIRSDGALLAWGQNNQGQCSVAQAPPGLHYVEVSAGNWATFALLNNGTAAGWGGYPGQSTIPSLPSGLQYLEIDAGQAHGLGRRSDGSVVAWGDNSHGQCNVPALPPGVTYVEIAAGWLHSIARRSDGAIVAWGDNSTGQCNVPALPPGLTCVEIAAGGQVSAYGFSIFRLSNGTVLASGANNYGQCNVPGLPLGLGYAQLSAGAYGAAARRTDGTVVRWGWCASGSCGNPPLPYGESYVQVAVGANHVVLRRSGVICSSVTAYCNAKINSLGCTPVIYGSGSPSATEDHGFRISAINVRNNKPGFLLYGSTGRTSSTFTGGILCVAGPIRRGPNVNSGGLAAPWDDCSGFYSFDLNAFRSGTLGGSPAGFLSIPGTVIDCQYWGRDPGFPSPNNTTLSGGLEFTIGP